ncbi:MAG: hypothetical protein ACQEP7_03655 [bacterium]
MTGMSVLEIIALFLIGVGLLELLICLFDPKLLLKIARPLYTRPALAQFFYLVVGSVVLYFLIQSGLTIVEVMATVLFAGCVMGLALAPIGRELLDVFSKQIFEGRFWKDYALAWIVWIALIIWTLLQIFS